MLSIINLTLGCVNGKPGEMSNESEYNPAQQVIVEEISHFVKLSGLPWKATEDEIADFLGDIEIIGKVHIATNEAGRPTGDAFVKLGTKADLDKAMKRSREYLHNRFVIVEESNSESYEKHNKKVQKLENEENTFIQLRGLIWSATVEDIKKFLHDCKVKKVVIKKNEHGRPTGDAFLQLDSEVDVDKAKSHNREYLGKRFVIVEEIYQSKFIQETQEVKETDKKETVTKESTRPTPIMKDLDYSTKHVKLSNLPRDLSEHDISSFLKDVTPKSVTMLKNGLALIELEAEDDIVRSLICHNSTLSSRAIKVDQIEKSEVTKIFESIKSNSGSTDEDFYVKLAGLPWKATKDEIRSFLVDIKIVGEVVIILNDHGKPSGDAVVKLQTKEDLQKALKCNRNYLHNRFVIVEETDGKLFAENVTTDRKSREEEKVDEPASVQLKGLVWSATENDIRSFLSDCTVKEIKINKNEQGRPTGEATVHLVSKSDLRKALAHDRQYLRERFVIVEKL